MVNRADKPALLVGGLIWLALGAALLAFPTWAQSRSREFEERRTLIPFPPLIGVPAWMVRVFGLIATGGAAVFFYLLLK